ncbi:type IV pilus biogenesis/stability protein PilW [Sphaerotilus montanus]|uniref:Type IV pilus assembly protein PilF n=2 Tax=Sphaerotilus montanus TaxID=522889 RepID=A0A7Y9R366_9BURK|nr:type IV pilus biogenesis/stability protein PilW [Sphaerotilus montanus]NYG34400.1 type IV pilus assembly protein PilF [Sphaerotilus montanus]
MTMTPLRWFERRTGRCGSLLLAAVLLAGCVSGPALPVPMGEASPTSINAPRPTNSSGSAAANAATGGRRDLVTESDESDSARRARIRTELAAAYFGQGQYVTALDEVKRALTVDPGHVPALGLRGLIYANMGEYELAEESFRSALRVRPADADTLHNYGWFLCQQRRFVPARQQFEAAMAVPQYRESARTLLAAGICEARAGELQAAQIILQRSFDQDPGNPATVFNLADVLKRRGDLERAFLYIQRLNQTPELVSPETLWLAIRIQHRRNLTSSVEELGSLLRARFPKSREAAAYDQGQFDE